MIIPASQALLPLEFCEEELEETPKESSDGGNKENKESKKKESGKKESSKKESANKESRKKEKGNGMGKQGAIESDSAYSRLLSLVSNRKASIEASLASAESTQSDLNSQLEALHEITPNSMELEHTNRQIKSADAEIEKLSSLEQRVEALVGGMKTHTDLDGLILQLERGKQEIVALAVQCDAASTHSSLWWWALFLIPFLLFL